MPLVVRDDRAKARASVFCNGRPLLALREPRRGLPCTGALSRRMRRAGRITAKRIGTVEEKESWRWLENVRQSSEVLDDPVRGVHIGDRESDIEPGAVRA